MTPPAPASSTLHASNGSLHGMRTTGGRPSAWYVWHVHPSVWRSSGMCSVSTNTKSMPVFLASSGHSGDIPTTADANTRRPSCRAWMISRPVIGSSPPWWSGHIHRLPGATRLQRGRDGGVDRAAGPGVEHGLAALVDRTGEVVGEP